MDLKRCPKCNRYGFDGANSCIWCDMDAQFYELSRGLNISSDVFSEKQKMMETAFFSANSFLEDMVFDEDEHVILYSRDASCISDSFPDTIDALILTNKNIILSYFVTRTVAIVASVADRNNFRIPLCKLSNDDNSVSIVNAKRNGVWLRIVAEDKECLFSFGNSSDSGDPVKWTKEIMALLKGNEKSNNKLNRDDRLIICSVCGRENIEGFRFCEYCGTSVKDTVAPSVVADIKNNRICSVCGFENDIGFKFCEACGTPVKTKQDDDIKICSCCGKQNKSKYKFCGYCGTTI